MRLPALVGLGFLVASMYMLARLVREWIAFEQRRLTSVGTRSLT